MEGQCQFTAQGYLGMKKPGEGICTKRIYCSYAFLCALMVFSIRRERMEAMEKQIASLTGLVQSVLTRGPDSP